MLKTAKITAIAAVLGLSGCGNTDLSRGLTGAAGGAVLAHLVGGSFLAGAILGGAAGVFCDDVRLCP